MIKCSIYDKKNFAVCRLPAAGGRDVRRTGGGSAQAAPARPGKGCFCRADRFDREDLYERMDRELIAFTYMHSSSLLMLKKSGRIFTQVVPILRREGVPEDLKYLMAIESNLNPKALSSAGAAGL